MPERHSDQKDQKDQQQVTPVPQLHLVAPLRLLFPPQSEPAESVKQDHEQHEHGENVQDDHGPPREDSCFHTSNDFYSRPLIKIDCLRGAAIRQKAAGEHLRNLGRGWDRLHYGGDALTLIVPKPMELGKSAFGSIYFSIFVGRLNIFVDFLHVVWLTQMINSPKF